MNESQRDERSYFQAKDVRQAGSRGEQTRRAILARAVNIAAKEGLAALTIGRLATELHMSKSGLFAHFHSKQALELATIERANDVFANAVLLPAQASGDGIERLWNLCDLWPLHIEQNVFSGAYFFTGALLEYADRPGPVAEAINMAARKWFEELRKAVEAAQERGEIYRDAAAERIARELNGTLVGAHVASLVEGVDCFRETRATVLNRLRELGTGTIPIIAFESVAAWKKHLKRAH